MEEELQQDQRGGNRGDDQPRRRAAARDMGDLRLRGETLNSYVRD
jgi:hypothetical protein